MNYNFSKDCGCVIFTGVSVMIWETWVSRSIQSALGLVEKVGRLPKDRLCRRDLGLCEHSLALVFKAASELLEQVLEVSGEVGR